MLTVKQQTVTHPEFGKVLVQYTEKDNELKLVSAGIEGDLQLTPEDLDPELITDLLERIITIN